MHAARGDGLDSRKRILDPVFDLPDEEVLLLLSPSSLSDVACNLGGAHDLPPSLMGVTPSGGKSNRAVPKSPVKTRSNSSEPNPLCTDGRTAGPPVSRQQSLAASRGSVTCCHSTRTLPDSLHKAPYFIALVAS